MTSRSHRRWLVAGLSVGAALAWLGETSIASRPAEHALLTALVLSALPWLTAFARGKLDPFEPTLLLSGIWLLAYIMPAAQILGGRDAVWDVWYTKTQAPTGELLARALFVSNTFLAVLFITFYGSGLILRQTQTPARHRPVVSRLRFSSGLLVLAALSSLTLLTLAVGGPNALLSNLNDRVRLFWGLNYLSVPIVALFAVMLASYSERALRRQPVGLGFALFAASAFALNSALGSKTNVLAAGLALVVTRHYLVKPLRVRWLAFIAAAAVVLGVGYDVVFREYLRLGEVVTVDASAAPMEIITNAWGTFSGNAFFQLQALMLMVDGMPAVIPYQGLEHYRALLLMPIPRAFYPGKPPLGTARFTWAFFPELDPFETWTIPTTLVGEFYMSAGIAGVVIGALVVGGLLRVAYAWSCRNRWELHAAPLYGLVAGTLLPWVRGDTFGPTVFFASVAVPLYLLSRFSRRALRS